MTNRSLLSSSLESRLTDKRQIRRALDAINRRIGFAPDPDATLETVRAGLRRDGVRPEENVLSRDLIAARYEDE